MFTLWMERGGYSICMKNRFGVPGSKLKDWLDGDEVPCTSES